ncbi:DUF2306 domain-containing protein [Glacieibacterium frigidum]|uniref:DUF2306 domain-containing protein n=1 Tax=Glacieibacterium frigidum TaxID=2593303 RepID=A0A552U8R2_9SPHN|nr:DUF2306 domain-containing protein [Glacieibacterium frigidum]TRW14606.1 DUF2306 domain-containing protein [Glacieibacterium frigidum]
MAARARVSAAGIIFTIAVVSTLPVIWTVVLPVLSGAARPDHAGHWLLVVLHALTGLITLIAGTLGLYIGWTRRWFEWHRHVGCTYLGAGLTMAAVALILSIQAPHPVKSIFVSTGVLSVVWSAVACMGWRAGANRREASHRDWMIRSYVLTWTFVFCRLAQRGFGFEGLGEEGVTAGIWLYWIGPLILCEIALQWRRGARLSPDRGTG